MIFSDRDLILTLIISLPIDGNRGGVNEIMKDFLPVRRTLSRVVSPENVRKRDQRGEAIRMLRG